MLYLKNFADLNTYEVLFIQNAAVPLKVMAGGGFLCWWRNLFHLSRVFFFFEKNLQNFMTWHYTSMQFFECTPSLWFHSFNSFIHDTRMFNFLVIPDRSLFRVTWIYWLHWATVNLTSKNFLRRQLNQTITCSTLISTASCHNQILQLYN